jgi:hypothetical protein
MDIELLEAILVELKAQTAALGNMTDKIQDLQVEIIKRFPCGEKSPEEMKAQMEKVMESMQDMPFMTMFKGMMGGRPDGK